jgi:hypothetical protein
LRFDSIKHFVISDMSLGDGVAFIADDNNDVATLDEEWICHD